LVEPSDLENGQLRLKGLCNVEVDDEQAHFEGDDHKDASNRSLPVVHWLPRDSKQEVVKMPDGSEITGKVERSLEPGETVQFERFGFVRKDADGHIYYTHS
jgi:tRNA synthetases class I (E and Q), anti-codon binding domain.